MTLSLKRESALLVARPYASHGMCDLVRAACVPTRGVILHVAGRHRTLHRTTLASAHDPVVGVHSHVPAPPALPRPPPCAQQSAGGSRRDCSLARRRWHAGLAARGQYSEERKARAPVQADTAACRGEWIGECGIKISQGGGPLAEASATGHAPHLGSRIATWLENQHREAAAAAPQKRDANFPTTNQGVNQGGTQVHEGAGRDNETG